MSLEKFNLSKYIESQKVNLGGPLLHKLVWWEKLSDFFSDFKDTLNIKPKIDKESFENINNFVENNNSWIIIWNHPNNNFMDVIPILAELPEEILRKTTFFSVKHTAPMFQNEFWENYDFQAATYDNISEAREWLKILKEKIEEVKNWKRFIFIIPWWVEEEGDYRKFKWIFSRIIEDLDNDKKILANFIDYDEKISYLDIYKRVFLWKVDKILWKDSSLDEISPRISSKIVEVGNFYWKSGEDSWKYYNELFN